MLPYSGALNPFPPWKQQAHEVLLSGTFPLLGCWPGRLAQAGRRPFSSALNRPRPANETQMKVVLFGISPLLGYWPGC